MLCTWKNGKVDGGLVYFGDMKYYGAGGEATTSQNAAAFRLLAVNPETRGKGLGKLLIQHCINQAKIEGFEYLIIHSTKSMMTASLSNTSRFCSIDGVLPGINK